MKLQIHFTKYFFLQKGFFSAESLPQRFFCGRSSEEGSPKKEISKRSWERFPKGNS
jgi:hypothetical protein